ncbi:hypothetical protein EGT74_02045 [Chitinophaga lutea]|uniref:Uncharacterized protein n=1 Tax=Chitinophaga lutea TaxID=2488634 RepID=A0A3N4Q8I7_9BACT|nr:hypothetical protein [Chitinophaga lutea]RPE12357.1 hypothetical protein EGT74_02045 [Chitinophaga lutea]
MAAEQRKWFWPEKARLRDWQIGEEKKIRTGGSAAGKRKKVAAGKGAFEGLADWRREKDPDGRVGSRETEKGPGLKMGDWELMGGKRNGSSSKVAAGKLSD